MSLLDVYAAQAGPASLPLIQTPSTPGERFLTDRAAADAPDNWWNFTGSRRDEHQKVVDALHTATGESFANPYGPVTPEEMMRLGNQPAIVEERKQKIRDARNVLQQDAGVGDVIPDPDMVDRQIGEQGEALRGKAASLVNTGNGLAAFAGGATALTPVNVAGLLIPPSRAVFGATTVARGFLAELGREAAYQGVTQGALTAASEGLDAIARTETGTAPTFGEAVGNVAMGAAAGAVLGGAFHGVHRGTQLLYWKATGQSADASVRDFHDFFNGSAAVDKEGRPLRVYHGTRAPDFEQFSDAHHGSNTGGEGDPAFYFSASPEVASGYAAGTAPGGRVIPSYLALKDPLEIHGIGDEIKARSEIEKAIEQAGAQGRDGVILRDVGGVKGNDTFIAFYPDQIKNAIQSSGPKTLWERWNRLPEPVKENAPLEVRDAMKVLETDTIYGEANRLGLPWAMHEKYQNAAADPILRGRGVRLEDLKPADTPMTALGTILRMAPDAVDARADLPLAAARVAALPDAELEPFVRQMKPGSFKALDDVNARIKALDQRTEVLHQEADQIGVADVADPDTAAILRDIEEKLQQPGLRAATREQLLHERAQWIETLDVHGGLTEALRQGRRDVFPEHLPQLREIAAERAKLQKELTIAQGEAQREVDFLRGKLDKIETGAPNEPVSHETFGADPADVAKGLEAAEFDRMIRTVRENVPGGERPAAAPSPREPAPKPTADGLAPEQVQAIKTAADAVMEGKSGALSDFKRAVQREMDGLDLELNDARSAAACVANGGGIP